MASSRKSLLSDSLLEVLLSDKLQDIRIFRRQEKTKDRKLCDKSMYRYITRFSPEECSRMAGDLLLVKIRIKDLGEVW